MTASPTEGNGLLSWVISAMLFGCPILSGCSGSATNAERVVFVADSAADAVSIRIIFGIDPGSTSPGAASMIAAAISNGLSPMSDSVLGALSKAGVRIELRAKREALMLDLGFPPETWSQIEGALLSLLSTRVLDGLQLEDLRKLQLERLRELKRDPAWLAESVFRNECLPGGSGTPAEGTDSTVSAITLEGLRSFWASHLTSGNCLMGISGDVASAQVQELEDAIMRALPKGVPTERKQSPVPLDGLNVRIVELPDVDATYLLLGTGLPHRSFDTAAWVFALTSAQQAAPGASRTGMDQFLRAERGLTDDVSFSTALANTSADGSFWKTDDVSAGDYFTITARSKDVNALYILRIIIKELTDIHTAGLTQNELTSLYAMIGKSESSQDATNRMHSLLAQKFMGVELPAQLNGEDPFPVTSVRARQLLRGAFDPRGLWIVAVVPDGQAFADQILSGMSMYVYPDWVNTREIRAMDQEYLSFRPFWQAAKIKRMRAEELFR